jgi:uncharacterized Zn finger protein
MRRLTRPADGLFPAPREIQLKCSCPDGSYCCKHIAAVMYGVGNRLDKNPDLLFLLRNVDHDELVTQAVAEGNLDRELGGAAAADLAGEDLGAIFGIELDSAPSSTPSKPAKRSKPAKTKTTRRRTSVKKPRVTAVRAAAKVANGGRRPTKGSRGPRS